VGKSPAGVLWGLLAPVAHNNSLMRGCRQVPRVGLASARHVCSALGRATTNRSKSKPLSSAQSLCIDARRISRRDILFGWYSQWKNRVLRGSTLSQGVECRESLVPTSRNSSRTTSGWCPRAIRCRANWPATWTKSLRCVFCFQNRCRLPDDAFQHARRMC
jgi:hypothetical protein